MSPVTTIWSTPAARTSAASASRISGRCRWRRRRHESALSWRFEKPLAEAEPRLERQVQVGDVGQRESVHRQCPLLPATPLSDHVQAYAAALPFLPRPVSARPVAARTASGIVVGESALRIWGLPSAVRLQRQLALAGALADETEATRRVLLRADWVYDDALVRGLVAAETDVALCAADGIAVALNVAAADAADAAALLAAGTRAGERTPGSERRDPGRRLQQHAAQARAAVPDAAHARRRCRRSSSASSAAPTRASPTWSRSTSGRGRRRCGDAALRQRRHHAEPGDLAQPGAGAGGDVRCSGPATTRSGLVCRLDHDLPRHGRRQAGARHPALHAVRQLLRPPDRPDPSAVLVVGLDRRPAGRRLRARRPGAGAHGHRRRLRPAAGRGRRVHRLLRHRDAHLAALRQPLPPDHGAPQSEPAAAHRLGAGRPAGPRHRRGRGLDRRLARGPCAAPAAGGAGAATRQAASRGWRRRHERERSPRCSSAELGAGGAGAGRRRWPPSWRRRAGESTAAVLFYGSALRDDALDGVLDFYVLTDRPIAWPGSR